MWMIFLNVPVVWLWILESLQFSYIKLLCSVFLGSVLNVNHSFYDKRLFSYFGHSEILQERLEIKDMLVL